MKNNNVLGNEKVYDRKGDFAVFNQIGLKLDFSNDISDEDYYKWLDEMKENIGKLVSGAEIAEKSYARVEPRLNTGVYYDTDEYRLLKSGMVLRTTCNIKTHAFCAFKLDEDNRGVRRDHRYIFDGEAKKTIQMNPTSNEAIGYVKSMLSRTDIDHPGIHLEKMTGIKAEDLSPALCIKQYRHPFFVWIDSKDALRCSMDRVTTFDLRKNEIDREEIPFSEIELPLYPHLEDTMLEDPRLFEVINVLADSLKKRFGVKEIQDSKYQRGAKLLGLI